MCAFNFNNTINEDCPLSISSYTMNSLGGDASTGFVYQVLPLAFNLELTDSPRKKNKNAHFSFYHGDNVKGISPYDNKEHLGIIKHIYYDETTGKPVLVYVMDLSVNNIIPLEISSLKRIKKTV